MTAVTGRPVVRWIPPGDATPEEADQVHAVVDAVADEFVPSLRTRTSTVQADLTGHDVAASCGPYVAAMLEQHCAVVTDTGGEVVAVLSARTEAFPLQDLVPGGVYLSTIAVAPRARRLGLARTLLRALVRRFDDRPVLSRTWSTNPGSIRLHERAGFTTFRTVPDDRGAGVDTVYLLRPPG